MWWAGKQFRAHNTINPKADQQQKPTSGSNLVTQDLESEALVSTDPL